MRQLSKGLVCFLAISGSHANVIQYFAGISYNNPADLFQIQNNQMIFGGTFSYADLKFTGSALNFNTLQYESGINHSKTFTPMPYGRIAKRIDKSTVFAIDVTQPFNSNLDWGTYAFTRYAATQNILWDVDISPKIEHSFSEKLHLGAGINFNFLRSNEINWAMPTGPSSSANLTNVTASYGTGFNLGATYLINQTNILGLTYYSKIAQDTRGYSILDNNVSNDLTLKFNMPATTVLSYVHIFNPEWLINLKAFRSEWSINQQARFYNTAAAAPFNNFIFTMNFNDSYAFLAAVRHQCTEKLGLTLAGMIDDGPEHDDLRTITFPSDTQFFLALVGDYHFNKTTSIELLYGHVFSNPPINNSVTTANGTLPFTTGKVNINADVVDVKIKIEA